jgi:hypothetical protein
MNEVAWEAARAGEIATAPELAKDPPVTGQVDECKDLGLVEGAQGVLTQPKMSQGSQAYLGPAAGLRRRLETNVERLIRCPGAARLKKTFQDLSCDRPPCD